MGVHHFNLVVIPRAFFGQQLPSLLSEAECDKGEDTAHGWWASQPPSTRFLAAVRALLPTDKSWGETEEYVSSDDWGSDVRVWNDAGKVWRVAFRFSPVSEDWALMQRFLAVVQDENCVLMEDESCTVFEPDERIVRERLIGSRALDFIRDPLATIVQAAKNLRDDAG